MLDIQGLKKVLAEKQSEKYKRHRPEIALLYQLVK
jgi:hypothetical protein